MSQEKLDRLKEKAEELMEESPEEEKSEWEKSQEQAKSRSVGHNTGERDGDEYVVPGTYGTSTAEKIEDQVQQFAYEMNSDDVGTDWSPQQIEDHRVARMFAVIVGKLAEDISYQEINGNEFWDAKKIMKRQIDNRPLHKCKKDYKQRKLALLVDTSPSCRDEAVFYSKISSGAMLRDDIDIFLCPNGHIDARFDREKMKFVVDERSDRWELDGRTILYFTDWDGSEEICHHSRSTNLYWFDNADPGLYWNGSDEHSREIRGRFRGTHYECQEKDQFERLARKIRP